MGHTLYIVSLVCYNVTLQCMYMYIVFCIPCAQQGVVNMPYTSICNGNFSSRYTVSKQKRDVCKHCTKSVGASYGSALESMRSGHHVFAGNSRYLVLPNTYAAALATKRGPVHHQYWNNEAKSRPVGRPHLIISSPSATGRTSLGQNAIIFGRTNIDSPSEQSPAKL